jgi:mRNA interferase MazF
MPRGDIFFVELPPPPGGSGHEQTGYRPVIVVSSERTQSDNPMVLAIPLTTNQAAIRFPHAFQIAPSPQNGLSEVSVAMVFQLAAIDKRRLRRRVGSLEQYYMQQVNQELASALDLP